MKPLEDILSSAGTRTTGFISDVLSEHPNLLGLATGATTAVITLQDFYFDSIKYGEDYSLDPVDWFLHFGLPLAIGGLTTLIGKRINEFKEKKQSEQALRESEERYRTLVQRMNEGLGEINERGLITGVNDALCMILRYPQEELIGCSVVSIVHENDQKGFAEHMRSLHGGDISPYELRFKAGDGTDVYTLISPQVIRDDDGNFKSSFAVITDITERKLSKKTLRESEEKFRALYDNSSEAVIVFDAETRKVVDVNATACELYGYALEDFMGLSPQDITVDLGTTGRVIASILRGKKAERVDVRHRKSDGTEFDVEVAASSFGMGSNRYFFAQVRDITERKQVEHYLGERIKEITGINALYTLISQTDNLEEMFNRFTTNIVPPSMQFPDKTIGAIEFNGETYGKLEELACSLTAPIMDRGEQIGTLSIGYTEDLQFIPEFEQELVNRYARILGAKIESKQTEKIILESERLSAIGEVAAGVAHDFNNALQSIMGNTELALFEGISPEAREYLTTVKKSASDAAARISQLQRFAGKRAELSEYEVLNINTVVDDALAQTRNLWKDHAQKDGLNIDIRTNYEEDLHVLGNDGELRSVLYNIIKNSVQAMPDGGTISIDTRKDDKNVFLTVTDTGTGMDEKTMIRVFQPFYTTKSFEQGTGLGMSGAYSIIKEHNGRIYVKNSAPGKGTSIEIMFPYAKRKATPKEETAPEYEGSARVLWVDDDEMIRDTGKRIITKLGHEVDVAASGQKALELLTRNEYDLMITDVGMPRMSGWQLAEQIKGKHPGMKVAVLTGWGDDVSAEQRKKYGVGYVLGKPIQMDQLKGLVGEVLQMKEKPTN